MWCVCVTQGSKQIENHKHIFDLNTSILYITWWLLVCFESLVSCLDHSGPLHSVENKDEEVDEVNRQTDEADCLHDVEQQVH